MLPSGHVEFTWAVLNVVQRSGIAPHFQNVDYRRVALAALAPDIIDKPLAVFVFPRQKSALLFAHTALAHILVWWLVAIRRPGWLPYVLAFSGHLILDRMWGFPQTLLWPLRGGRFHQWRDVGSPQAFVRAYYDIVRQEPKLAIFELAGLAMLIWLILDRRLYQPRRLWHLIKTGRMPAC